MSTALVRCLSTSLRQPDEARRQFSPPDDWEIPVAEALRQNVAAIVYELLTTHAPTNLVAARAMKPLRNAYLYTTLRNRGLLRQCHELVTAFRAAGVQAVFLKGVHLALTVYRSPALRPMLDIDVLVRPGQLDDAARVLSGLGYSSSRTSIWVDCATHQHKPPFVRVGSSPVELHRSLVAAGAPFQIDLEGLWQRARRTPLFDDSIWLLSPEDALLHLCVHIGYNHRFKVPLLQLYDVAALLETHGNDLDWSGLLAIADADRRDRFLAVTLLVAARLFDVRLPDAVSASLRQHHISDGLTTAIIENVLRPDVELPYVHLELAKCHSLGGKLRAIARSVAPPPRELRETHRLAADQSVLWHYLTRPLDVFARRGRLVVKILCGLGDGRPAARRYHNLQHIAHWIDRDTRPR